MTCVAPPAAAVKAPVPRPLPGSDPASVRGGSVLVTDLSNGNAQRCIVLSRVAVVTAGRGQRRIKEKPWRKVEES